MGVIIKQGSRGVVATYLGTIVGAATLLYFFPKYLQPDEIGLLRVLVEMAALFAFFSQFGMSTAIIRFHPKHILPTSTSDGGFFGFVNLIPFFGFLVCTLLFLLLQQSIMGVYAERSALLNEYIILIIPMGFFMLYQDVQEYYATANMKVAWPKMIREVLVRVLVLLFLLLYCVSIITFKQLVYSYLLTYGLAMLANLLYLLKKVPYKLEIPTIRFVQSSFTNYRSYLFFMLLTGLGGTIVTKIDLFMLSAHVDLAAAGIYSIAFFMATMIVIPHRVVNQIASPLIAKAIANEDYNSVDSIYKKIASNQVLIAGGIFSLIVLNLQDIFSLIPNGEIYQEGIWVVILVGISRVYNCITGVNAAIIFYSKYYRYYLYMMISLGALAIITNALLIPLYGLTGAAMATLISILLYETGFMWLVYKKMQLHPFQPVLLKSLCILILIAAICFFLPGSKYPFVNLLITSSVYSLLLLGAIMAFNLSSEMKDTFIFYLNKGKAKLKRHK